MPDSSVRSKITVIVPARDRPDLLAACLDRLVRQTMDSAAYEVVVCDDGSAVNLAHVVAQHNGCMPAVRLLQQSAKGPAAARNLGVRGAVGPVLVFVDSDILVDREFVRKLCEALDSHPNWVGAEARVEAIDGEDNPLWDAPVGRGGAYGSGAIAFRRSTLVAAGGFDEAFSMPACEDVELATRILGIGPIGYVPEAVAYHPRRRVTFRTCWRWRKFWRFTMILAVRHGFLAWPGKRTRFPRLRTALAAVVTLPAGRCLEALTWMWRSPRVGGLALAHSLFDVVCGVAALPQILFGRIPERKAYLETAPAGVVPSAEVENQQHYLDESRA